MVVVTRRPDERASEGRRERKRRAVREERWKGVRETVIEVRWRVIIVAVVVS